MYGTRHTSTHTDGLQDKEGMIDKAVRYLEHRLEEKQRPLTAAITAYALALAGSEWSREFNMKLMDHVLTTPQGEFNMQLMDHVLTTPQGESSTRN